MSLILCFLSSLNWLLSIRLHVLIFQYWNVATLSRSVFLLLFYRKENYREIVDDLRPLVVDQRLVVKMILFLVEIIYSASKLPKVNKNPKVDIKLIENLKNIFNKKWKILNKSQQNLIKLKSTSICSSSRVSNFDLLFVKSSHS